MNADDDDPLLELAVASVSETISAARGREVRSELRRVVRFVRQKNKSLSDAASSDLIEFYALRRKRGASDQFIAKAIFGLQRAYDVLVARGHVARNPAKDVPRSRFCNPPVSFDVDREQLAAILEYATAALSRENLLRRSRFSWSRRVVTLGLAMDCGAQWAELANLRMAHLDLGRACILFASDTSRARPCPLTEAMRRALEHYLDLRTRLENISTDAVFVSSLPPHDGLAAARLSNDAWRVIRAVPDDGGGRPPPRMFRRSIGSAALRKGHGWIVVRQLLGCATVPRAVMKPITVEELAVKLEKFHPLGPAEINPDGK